MAGALKNRGSGMNGKTAIRIAVVCAIFLSIVALRFLNDGRTWTYMENHLGLTVLLPLVAIFFGLLAQRLSVEYRQGSAKAREHKGMTSAKI
jgi:hypothetical protein